MDMTVSDLFGVVGSLVGVVAVLYMRNVAIQIGQLRTDNEKLWKNIGELRGALQSTRENYVTKKDFDGAVIRMFNKLDLIDGKFLRLLPGNDCQKRLEEMEAMWRNINGCKDD